MVGSSSSGFSDLVIVSEKIENCLKISKIQDTLVVAKGAKKPHPGPPKIKTKEEISVVTKNVQSQFQAPMAVVPCYLYAAMAHYQHPPLQQAPTGYQQPHQAQVLQNQQAHNQRRPRNNLE